MDASEIQEIYNDGNDSLDLSFKGLQTLPQINITGLKYLYLENNKLQSLSEEFFPSVPHLVWLDLRNNQLSSIPATVRDHPSLANLLLQNNNIQSLPNELGTLPELKTLLLNGNPLIYPEKSTLNLGVVEIKTYLTLQLQNKEKEIGKISETTSEEESLNGSPKKNKKITFENKIQNFKNIKSNENITDALVTRNAYNVPAVYKFEVDKIKDTKHALSVQVYDRESLSRRDYEKRVDCKCPKLERARSRSIYVCNSMKYVRPVLVGDKDEETLKIRAKALKEMARAKHKELLERREATLQARRNLELLHEWRQDYRNRQSLQHPIKGNCFVDRDKIPFDVDPNCSIILSRADLMNDLPDKYKKKLKPRSKMTIPRVSRSAEEVIMRKINRLFDNLEDINQNRDTMTPRTEQSLLLKEIEKINEIKEQLTELSLTNFRTVLM